jgi:hypothetical protein
MTVTREEKRAEAERELRLRRGVYAKQVAAGKMKPEEAEHRLATMAAIAADYGKPVRVEPERAAIYFLDGGTPRRAAWYPPTPEGREGHYAVPAGEPTIDEAFAAVSHLLAQRDELVRRIERLSRWAALLEVAIDKRGAFVDVPLSRVPAGPGRLSYQRIGEAIRVAPRASTLEEHVGAGVDRV